MVSATEGLIPLADGPPHLDERQITPEQLLDMQLGYLSNLGAEVELVTTETGRTVPITIVAVGRTFLFGERPDGSERVSQSEIDTSRRWRDCDYVTFYTTFQTGEGMVYDYDHFSYGDLGLAPVRNEMYRPVGWHPEPVWYLRWPADPSRL